MRVAGLKASPVRVMLAAQLDTLNMLLWMQTKDAAKGRNRPAQILPNFLVSEETEEKEIMGFDSISCKICRSLCVTKLPPFIS